MARVIIRKVALTLLGVVAGGVGGVMAATLARSDNGKHDLNTVHADRHEPAEPTTVASPRSFQEKETRRVAAPTAQGTPSLAEAMSARRSEDDLDPIAYQQSLVSLHTAAVAAHEREPLDVQWARAAAGSLKDQLVPLGQSHAFEVMSVDCRTATCVAQLTFASYADAQKNWQSVLDTPNQVGCGTEIALDVPDEPLARYDLSVVYDCAAGRASVASK